MMITNTIRKYFETYRFAWIFDIQSFVDYLYQASNINPADSLITITSPSDGKK